MKLEIKLDNGQYFISPSHILEVRINSENNEFHYREGDFTKSFELSKIREVKVIINE